MGFWKDVAYDMSRGLSRDEAIELNCILRDPNIPKEEKRKIDAKFDASIKVNSML